MRNSSFLMWSNGTNVSNSSNRRLDSNISPKVVSASIVPITLDKKVST